MNNSAWIDNDIQRNDALRYPESSDEICEIIKNMIKEHISLINVKSDDGFILIEYDVMNEVLECCTILNLRGCKVSSNHVW